MPTTKNKWDGAEDPTIDNFHTIDTCNIEI